MYFEVSIPSGGTSHTQRTLQVEARSWRSALLASLAQVDGAMPESLENFYVDLGADAITVTDPARRHTIRIAELDEKHVRASQTLKAVTGQFQPITGPADSRSATPPPGRPGSGVSAARRALGFTDRATGTFRAIVSTEIKKSAVEAAAEGRVLQDTVAPSPNDSIIEEVPVARAAKKGAAAPAAAEPAAPSGPVSETALEDVFLEIMTLFEPGFGMEAAIDFCLDLATKHIPCGSTGLLFASDAADHLYFAAARGDAKKKLGKLELSILKGIPAAVLREGVAIASASLADDARHTTELAEKSGLAVESICCAPIQAGDRAFGVLLLMNRKERSFFSQYDSNIATYIGSQMGRYIQDQLDAAPLD